VSGRAAQPNDPTGAALTAIARVATAAARTIVGADNARCTIDAITAITTRTGSASVAAGPTVTRL